MFIPMDKKRCPFEVYSQTYARVRVVATDGTAWEATLALTVMDVNQTGVDDKGRPNFDFDLAWNARWHPVVDN